MENLFILLALASLICFLLSWIIPNKFSPLFRNKLSKGKIRLVFGLSIIIFLVLVGMASDNNDEESIKGNQEDINVESVEELNKTEEITEDTKAANENIVYTLSAEGKSVSKDRIEISGTTNLPDGSLLDIGVDRISISVGKDEEEFFSVGADYSTVKNGNYKIELTTNDKKFLDFEKASDDQIKKLYDEVEISVLFDPSSKKQPQSVVGIVGQNGEKLESSPNKKVFGSLTSNPVNELIVKNRVKSPFPYINELSGNIIATNNSGGSQGKTYREIFSFNGEGAKNSEPFTITGSKFRIKYDCSKTTTTPLCQAVLRSPNDESLYKEIFNTIGENQSETIFYEKGTFYIEATVMGGEFDIIVEEYK